MSTLIDWQSDNNGGISVTGLPDVFESILSLCAFLQHEPANAIGQLNNLF